MELPEKFVGMYKAEADACALLSLDRDLHVVPVVGTLDDMENVRAG